MYRYFSINLLTVPYLWIFLLFCHVISTFWWSHTHTHTHIMSTLRDPSCPWSAHARLKWEQEKVDFVACPDFIARKVFRIKSMASQRVHVIDWNYLDEKRCGEDHAHKLNIVDTCVDIIHEYIVCIECKGYETFDFM